MYLNIIVFFFAVRTVWYLSIMRSLTKNKTRLCKIKSVKLTEVIMWTKLKSVTRKSASFVFLGLLLLGLFLLINIFEKKDIFKNTNTFNALCHLPSSCKVDMGEAGELVLSFEPRRLIPMQPLNIRLALPLSLAAESVEFLFEGKAMSMHLPIVPLAFSEKNESSNVQYWSGTSMITHCTMNPDMIWVADLTIVTKHAPFKIRIDLLN